MKEGIDEPRMLLVVGLQHNGSEELWPGDFEIKEHLERLGYHVSVVSYQQVGESDGSGKDLIFISSSAAKPAGSGVFLDIDVPIVVANDQWLEHLGMVQAVSSSSGSEDHQTRVRISDHYHPISVHLAEHHAHYAALATSEIEVNSNPVVMVWGKPGPCAAIIATLADRGPELDNVRVALFAYEANARMPRWFAPARRVGCFFTHELARTANDDGWKLFDAAVHWASLRTKPFKSVFEEEWQEIRQRRVLQYEPLALQEDETSPPRNLVGLALSGGGIRSATFNLGFLQGLHGQQVLPLFDYLSTVSGGGFIGGWWSAWLARQKHFTSADILKPREFVLRLRGDTADPCFKTLFNLLGKETKEALRQFNAEDKANLPSPELVKALVNELNEIIDSVDLLENFKLLEVNGRARALLGQKTEGYDATNFNRLLLEALYPKFIRQTGLFPPPEEIEPTRESSYTKGPVAEGSLSAGDDPIHHVRLFANYLNPRKSILSGDIWRITAVVTRCLLMTWLMLVPILFVLVLLGEFYFVALDCAGFHHYFPLVKMAPAYLQNPHIQHRLWVMGAPLAATVLWMLTLTVLWIINNQAKARSYETLMYWAGAVALVVLAAAIWGRAIFGWLSSLTGLSLNVTLTMAALTIGLCWYVLRSGDKEIDAQRGTHKHIHDDSRRTFTWRRELCQNKIIRLQAKLAAGFAALFLTLAITGFGPDLLYTIVNLSGRAWQGYVARSGGLLAVAVAIFGTIFTMVKKWPINMENRKGKGESWMTRAIFKITPPLVLLVLALALSSLSHWLIQQSATAENLKRLGNVVFVFLSLSLFFAISEMEWRQSRRARVTSAIIISTLVGVAGIWLKDKALDLRLISQWPCVEGAALRYFMGSVVALIGILILLRLLTYETREKSADGVAKKPAQRTFRVAWMNEEAGRPLLKLALKLFVVALMALGLYALLVLLFGSFDQNNLRLKSSFAFTLVCFVPLAFEILFGDGNNRRALWLIACAYVLIASLFATSLWSKPGEANSIEACVGLVGAAATWVIALGWMADPNELSLHPFYKARLMRAYLGASNIRRQAKEISVAAVDDDVLLSRLRNCQRGAPYHLINTTLNLVATRDLATAQRSAAAFVMSRLYCGSPRTGYRQTDHYTQGRLSLTTAIAASGAALSPNMGSKTQNTALAMLMTLMNIRLGYWTPTPNKRDWQLPQARLWPFYLMREFFSQTNDLSTYCYLTDGGHFDNTGLYSLVERGCKYIVISDSSEDSKLCFADIGEAIRRCRIDFGTEIDLDITAFRRRVEKPGDDDPAALSHCVVGTITYSKSHARELGWKGISDDDRDDRGDRRGIVVYFKPSLGGQNAIDVRQYGFQNDRFPHQSTVDQWFDESQFESYRKLGEECAGQAFAHSGDQAKDLPSVAPASAMTFAQVENIFENLAKSFNAGCPKRKAASGD